jgi:RNA polymerase sigma-70 factor (ECF subfamily)
MAAEKIKRLLSQVALHDDTLAYRELFIIYHQKLVAFSASITHCIESSEEIVSDVFMKIWLQRRNLTTIDNFHLYIYIITKNLSINRLLKDKKRRSFSLDEMEVNLTSLHLDPEMMMITAEMSRRIQEAIQSLPPRCRLIFKLIKEDGLSYKETAELLELALKTIENQMTIAFKKIGECIRLELPKPSLN